MVEQIMCRRNIFGCLVPEVFKELCIWSKQKILQPAVYIKKRGESGNLLVQMEERETGLTVSQ